MPKALTKEEFIEKANKKYNFKFDYSKVEFVNRNTPVTIICPEHGEFKASPGQHLYVKNKTGCSKCGAKLGASHTKLTTEEFVLKSKEVHGDKYDYSLVEYTKAKDKVKIICPMHGEFLQDAYSHTHGAGCPSCKAQLRKRNKIMTKEEFLNKAYEKYGNNYDFSLMNYIDGATPITIRCKKHNHIFTRLPSRFLQRQACPICGKERQGKNFLYDTETFIKKAKVIHGDKYDYSNTQYNGCEETITYICPIHGEITQNAAAHLQGQGCRFCNGNLPLSNEEFEAKAKEIHGDKYDYSKVNYVNSHTNVEIICKTHQKSFFQMPYKHLLEKQGCPMCSDSKLEEGVNSLLTTLGINFIRQQKFTELGDLRYDFCLPDYKILIECQGIQHTENNPFFHTNESDFQYQLERDYKKYKFAVDNQYTMLYLFDVIEILLDKPEFNGIYENKEHIFNSFNGLENWLKNIKNNKQALYN